MTTEPTNSRPSLFTYLIAEQHQSGFSSASTAAQVISRYGSAKKTVFVTGASSAVGGALCAELCRAGATVIMGYCHSEAQVVVAAEQLMSEAAPMGGRAVPVPCDLSSRGGAQACAAEVQALNLRLHAIVHCASTTTSDFTMTCDGVESHFAINFLNPLLLTLLLLPIMGIGGTWGQGPGLPVSHKGDSEPPSNYAPRVVWCTCSAHHISYMPPSSSSGCLLAWRVSGEAARSAFMPAQAFGQSKLACVMAARQLAVRAAAAGVPLAVFAVHPGVTQDGLTRYVGYPPGSWFHGIKSVLAQGLASAGCLKSPGQAAASLAYAALAPELLDGGMLNAEDCWSGWLAGAGGAAGAWGYIEDCALSMPSTQARSIPDSDRLWEMSESMLLEGLGPKVVCPLLRRPESTTAATSDNTDAPGQPEPEITTDISEASEPVAAAK